MLQIPARRQTSSVAVGTLRLVLDWTWSLCSWAWLQPGSLQLCRLWDAPDGLLLGLVSWFMLQCDDFVRELLGLSSSDNLIYIECFSTGGKWTCNVFSAYKNPYMSLAASLGLKHCLFHRTDEGSLHSCLRALNLSGGQDQNRGLP